MAIVPFHVSYIANTLIVVLVALLLNYKPNYFNQTLLIISYSLLIPFVLFACNLIISIFYFTFFGKKTCHSLSLNSTTSRLRKFRPLTFTLPRKWELLQETRKKEKEHLERVPI